jgi:small conductance mechanosensitive channel
MLRKFIRNIVYAVLLTFAVIAAIGALGIQTASLVAIIGAAGLAIGLALQGSLANFAAGVLMIIFRPYKLADLVQVAGTEGFVEEVDVFTTTLRLPDKTKIIIPNGQIMSDKIINYTESEDRRLDLVVGIGYEDDIDKAREVLLAAVKESDYVLDEPAPAVSVAELGDSSVNLAVRPWVKSAKYAPASHEVTERVKKALDKAGISIPFPQRDIHVYDNKG